MGGPIWPMPDLHTDQKVAENSNYNINEKIELLWWILFGVHANDPNMMKCHRMRCDRGVRHFNKLLSVGRQIIIDEMTQHNIRCDNWSMQLNASTVKPLYSNTYFWFLLQKIVSSRYEKWMDIDINLQWPNSIKFHLRPAQQIKWHFDHYYVNQIEYILNRAWKLWKRFEDARQQ